MNPILDLKREAESDLNRVTDSVLSLFNDRKWKPLSKHLVCVNGFYPNWIFYNMPERLLAVVSYKPDNRRDFSITEKALAYVADTQTRGKVRQSYVVLALQGENQVLGYETAGALHSRLANAPTCKGKYGTFWGVDLTFQPTGDRLPF